jgi:hypothetical protein
MRGTGRLWIAAALLGTALLACAPPPPPQLPVLAIGDSVMEAAAPALTSRGIPSDTLQSRQFLDAVPLVQTLDAAGRLPATVIVHLGTNGLVGDATCDALVASIGQRILVLVNVNLNGTRSWEQSVNATLAACAARHGLRLVDWKGRSTGQPWFEPDLIHLNAAGRNAYADLLRASV